MLMWNDGSGDRGNVEIDDAAAGGTLVELGKLLLRSGQAHLDLFYFAEPSFAFSLGNAGEKVVTDLHEPITLGGLGPEHRAANACIRCPVLRPDPEQMPRLEEIHANLLDRLQEAKEQGWLGEVAAIEASLAAAEQKLAAMRDLAARHTTVHLGMPDLRGFVARIDSGQRNEDAKRQS